MIYYITEFPQKPKRVKPEQTPMHSSLIQARLGFPSPPAGPRPLHGGGSSSGLRTPLQLQSLVLLPVGATCFPGPGERSLRGEESARPPPSGMHNSVRQVSQIPSEGLLGNWTEATPSCCAHPRPVFHRERPGRGGRAQDVRPPCPRAQRTD